MENDLEQKINDYMASHKVCTIALSDSNSPSAHTVYYISNGLIIYFESNPGSDKIKTIRANSKISLTIDEDYLEWKDIKGIQLFGRARIIDSRDNEKLNSKFLEKFPHLNDIGGIPDSHVFVEVTPEKIHYLDFSNELGHKSTYFPKDVKASFLSKINW